jgi:hypothetical protein
MPIDAHSGPLGVNSNVSGSYMAGRNGMASNGFKIALDINVKSLCDRHKKTPRKAGLIF